MVSAAHPLVKQGLFRFSAFHYITKGVIFMTGLLCAVIGDIQEGGVHPQGEVQCVQW